MSYRKSRKQARANQHVPILFCNCCVIFMVNSWKRYGQKLRRIILLPFELITFWFAYGKNENPSFLWFRDFRTCPWLPKPIIFIFGNTRIPQITRETTRSIFRKSYFWKSQHFGNRTFWKVRKRRAPTTPDDPLNQFLKIMNMRSKSSRNGILVIWNQYFSKNMKWHLWTFETNKLWNQETKQLWIHEIQKLRK